MEPKVAIVMGSDSDFTIMQGAAEILNQYKISHEITIVSAHRTPKRLFEFASIVHERGIKVIIAGAGGAAHLPGMMASLTYIPVIGVPIKLSLLDGMDSLLSIVQMPTGVPVATMAINGAKNAGILTIQILALSDNALRDKLIEYKKILEKEVVEKAEKYKI